MKKQVSLMYKKLLMDMSDNTQYVKLQWEMELNVILEDNSWDNICASCHKGIGSQLWREFDWKVQMRFFRTPLKTFLSKSSITENCWRNCGLVGDHTHIFWDCPRLQHFWKAVKDTLEKILKGIIPSDPVIFLLDVFPDYFTHDPCFLLHVLLMTARKMVTVNWMKPDTPNINHWTQKIRHYTKWKNELLNYN